MTICSSVWPNINVYAHIPYIIVIRENYISEVCNQIQHIAVSLILLPFNVDSVDNAITDSSDPFKNIINTTIYSNL